MKQTLQLLILPLVGSVSWDMVPEPTTATLLLGATVLLSRRRR